MNASAWDREHEHLTTGGREEQLPHSSPTCSSGRAAQQPAWASGHMEELRCQIQAMWVASGDVDWLSMIMRDRAEERSRAVRAQLVPLLPEGGIFALGELLFYDRATMLEKVTLVLAYEYGVDPQYLQPYTPLGHLVLGHGPTTSSSPLPAASSAWSVFDVERLTDTVRAALGVAPELPGLTTVAGAGEAAGDEERAAAAVAEMSLRALAEAVYQALEPERSFWTYG
ncbi:hypothetical protein HYH02_002295 [Chlamydomonas schloesseri]|uniref:Uncharacterized protein n=1 Tax=Chlamydomonas schloesseri TaxID=2026947 RepID=A0A835WTF3_9CHLO|nr:hypothetical protein HYH02_002295 [Chlamydomonas schloesseri]|eukprot:KAG2452958.1 hypothetical protein HYH02_002295 [Chlamydomonas schloesseri]